MIFIISYVMIAQRSSTYLASRSPVFLLTLFAWHASTSHFLLHHSLELVVAERNLVITTAAVKLGSDRSNSRLELRKLVLVVLSLGFRVLFQPCSLLLEGIKDGLLVIRRKLSTETLRVSNLVLE
jgi:hypothetical protein